MSRAEKTAPPAASVWPAAAPANPINSFQASKFKLMVDLKTAKTLGLTVPPILFAQADEVIE